MSRPFGGRAAQHRYALVLFARDAHRAGVEVPPAIAELVDALTDAMSEVGHVPDRHESIDDVRTYGTPDEVGRAVGLTGRQVRRLCRAGKVAHEVVGVGRYLVDLEDLQRYLREAA